MALPWLGRQLDEDCHSTPPAIIPIRPRTTVPGGDRNASPCPFGQTSACSVRNALSRPRRHRTMARHGRWTSERVALVQRDTAVDARPGTRGEVQDPTSVVPGLLMLAVEDPSRAGPRAIASLQRTVGNRAVVEVLQRQRATPRQLPTPTNDQIVAEIGPSLGGPFTDYERLRRVDDAPARSSATRSDRGVDRSSSSSSPAPKARSTTSTPCPAGGVRRTTGSRTSAASATAPGFHGWGIAIDIDVARNPYVMHEEGDEQIDAQVRAAYHNTRGRSSSTSRSATSSRSSRRSSARPAAAPPAARRGRRGRAGEYFDRLQHESDAMKRYFELMNDQSKLAAFLATEWPTDPSKRACPGGRRPHSPDVAGLRGPRRRDPRGGPPGVTGFTPPAAVDGGDRPFNPTSAGQQDPGRAS